MGFGFAVLTFRGERFFVFSHAAHFSDTTSGAGKRPRLVVLGGGLAGLAAAREALLKHPGCDVLVLEREAQVGGMAVSVRFGDCVSDLGPHRIYSAIPEMRQWFQDTVGDGLYTVRRQSRMYVRGRYLQYPPSVGQMVSAFGVPNMAKFGTGYAWAKARSLAGMIDTSSFGGVMERSFGRPLCEAMVFPYMRKTWKIEPDKISAEAARIRATMGGVGKMLWRMVHPQQRAGEESTLKSFHYVRGGIGNLAIKLREDVERLGGRVICRADVRRVTLENGRGVWGEDRNAESEIWF
ncbi:TPA: hypothetical protein DDW35_07895, partial [Candidatus Sumerlaeota bacterium]|nr:hypothetical protein [Candidatus Sumerlaeota bacterium]